jgi:hypothetical protein
MKTIRIWNGCTVVGVVSVGTDGTFSTSGPVGGAENAGRADIEIDPWRGYVVEHEARTGVVSIRDVGE